MLFLLIGIAFSQDINEFYLPKRDAVWCQKPKVIVCDSDLNKDVVYFSYNFLGEKIRISRKQDCSCDLDKGKIKFGVNGCLDQWKEEGDYGRTLIASKDGCIFSSLVQIYKYDELVITHEAGHSIGYSHSGIINNIMFPFYEGVGWDLSGIEK